MKRALKGIYNEFLSEKQVHAETQFAQIFDNFLAKAWLVGFRSDFAVF